MSFPHVRLQRYRLNPQIRDFLAETELSPRDFIMPLFVNEALEEKRPIPLLPNIFQQSHSSLLEEVKRLVNIGVTAVIIFGIPKKKDPQGSEAYHSDGVVQVASRTIKEAFPDLILIADCCLCEYTSHGHCGVMEGGCLQNDQTLDLLKKTAITYAENGVDVVAPSGMMDGMVKAIREALNGYPMVSIMSYAVKYASNLYGPFREAAGSLKNFIGNRKHHQLAFSQKREALREALLDVEEGADYLMVKPGVFYLDMIQTLKKKTLLPIVAYHVSGEYAMIKAAAKAGVFEEAETFVEAFLCMKRAGADAMITYYADQILKRI